MIEGQESFEFPDGQSAVMLEPGKRRIRTTGMAGTGEVPEPHE